GLPELGQGLLPGLGGIHRLADLVGRSRALELIAAGGFIDAEEAHRWGLVNRLVPRKTFMESVMSFVQGILAVDPRLVAEVIRLTARSAATTDQTSVLELIESIAGTLPSQPALATT